MNRSEQVAACPDLISITMEVIMSGTKDLNDNPGASLPLDLLRTPGRTLTKKIKRIIAANGFPAPAHVLIWPTTVNDIRSLGAHCEDIARELNAPIALYDGSNLAYARGYRDDGTY